MNLKELFLSQVLKIVVDDSLYECGTMCVVLVASVYSRKIHEDNACGTCGVSVEIIEKGFVGVGGIVAVTVAQ